MEGAEALRWWSRRRALTTTRKQVERYNTTQYVFGQRSKYKWADANSYCSVFAGDRAFQAQSDFSNQSTYLPLTVVIWTIAALRPGKKLDRGHEDK